jgi:hypothetical protein
LKKDDDDDDDDDDVDTGSPFKKLRVTQLVKGFPAFNGIESSSFCSQKPATGTYPEPACLF